MQLVGSVPSDTLRSQQFSPIKKKIFLLEKPEKKYLSCETANSDRANTHEIIGGP
jgi:hypothetical protein